MTTDTNWLIHHLNHLNKSLRQGQWRTHTLRKKATTLKTNFRSLTKQAIQRMRPATAYQLAKVMRVRPQTVYKWRDGQREPHGDNAIRLSILAKGETLGPDELADNEPHRTAQRECHRSAITD